jgi:hypothetical protein
MQPSIIFRRLIRGEDRRHRITTSLTAAVTYESTRGKVGKIRCHVRGKKARTAEPWKSAAEARDYQLVGYQASENSGTLSSGLGERR